MFAFRRGELCKVYEVAVQNVRNGDINWKVAARERQKWRRLRRDSIPRFLASFTFC